MLVGANPDELKELATRMDDAATRLAPIHGQVLALIERSPWEGPNAVAYHRQWRDSKGQVDAAAQLLRSASEALRRNAEDQLRASAAEGGEIGATAPSGPVATAGPGIGTGLIDAIHDLAESMLPPDLQWARGEGRAELEAMLGRSPAEQLAWWNGLTPGQQEAMILANPLLLLMLNGLPADARAKANRQAIETIGNDLESSTATMRVDADGKIYRVLKLGLSGELVIAEFPDGRVEVTVLAGGQLGAGIKAAGGDGAVALGGDVASTYEFGSMAEADKFVKGLYTSPLPDGVLDGVHALAPGQQGAYLAGEVLDYLDSYSGNLKETVVTGEVTGSLSFEAPGGAGKITVDGAAGLEYNTTTHEKTLFLDVGADGRGQFGPWAGASAADARVAITLGPDNAVSDLALSGSFSNQGGTGALSDGLDIFNGAGTEGTFEIKVDLSNPGNRALATEFIRAQASGDLIGAASALNQLRSTSQIVVETNVVTTSSGKLDAVVASAGYSVSTSTSTGTWIQPPNGDFSRL